MISHKHKCIFVHVPKAAGTSIERAFMEDLGLDMDNRHSLILGSGTNKSLGPRRVSHLKAEEFVSQHYLSEDIFKSYFKFAFVRDPYDRLFSTYKMLGYSDFLSFEGFIRHKLNNLLKSKDYGFFLLPAYQYLYSSDNKLLVDFVGKFENLNEDFKKVLNEIGLRNLNLKHYNKHKESENRLNSLIKIPFKMSKNIKAIRHLSIVKPKKELTETSKKIVLDIYNMDFETFGYTKNLL